MRIERLALERYGHFTDREIDLGGENVRLHVLLGAHPDEQILGTGAIGADLDGGEVAIGPPLAGAGLAEIDLVGSQGKAVGREPLLGRGEEAPIVALGGSCPAECASGAEQPEPEQRDQGAEHEQNDTRRLHDRDSFSVVAPAGVGAWYSLTCAADRVCSREPLSPVCTLVRSAAQGRRSLPKSGGVRP